jgi:hypothetical protein
MHLFRNILLGALLASGQPALAQPTPKDPDGPIIITGQKLKEVLRNFVNSVTQIGPTDQLAAWDREICPRIVGLDETQTEYVFQRMAQIAREVRVKTSKRGCPTMLTIVVTRDTSTIARVIAEDFASDNIKVRNWLRKFVEAPGPARWISLVNECGAGCTADERVGSLPNTRLTKATKPKLQAMIILVDSTRLEGVTIGQLADYLALVALTNPPVDAPQDRRSILSLFNGIDGVPATELTNVDLSLLIALYNIREEFGANEQRASMVTRMAKELRRGNEPPSASQPQR